jgi:hypothetical protein
VQHFALRQSFNRGDLLAVVHHGEREAGINAPAVQQSGARATLPLVAASFEPVRSVSEIAETVNINRSPPHAEQKLLS